MSITVDRRSPPGQLEISGSALGIQPARIDDSMRRQSRATILIVEENDVARCGLKLIMVSQKWVSGCVCASDVSSAIDLIGQRVPDVILYGARPKLDGAHQAGRVLRATAPTSVLVLMTGADRVTAQTLNLVGAVAHISRNCPAADIVKSVRLASLGLTVSDAGAPTLLSTRQQEHIPTIAMATRGAP